MFPNPFAFWLAAMLPPPPIPRAPSILAGEIDSVTVQALPDAVMLHGDGPDARLFAELSIQDAVRLRCDLDEAIERALAFDRTGDNHRPGEPA